MARESHRWQFGHPSTSDLHQEELYKPDCIGRRTETPFWSRERRDFWAFQNRDARCWHFWAPGGRYAAVDASAPWLELKTKLWFRDRGRAFFGQIGILAPRVCLARFTDSPVVSTQPDPRFSPVNTLPLCIKLLLYARLLLLAPRDETTRCRRWPPSFHMTELRLALLFSLSCLLAQVRLRASTPSFVVRVSFPRRHRSLLQFPQS